MEKQEKKVELANLIREIARPFNLDESIRSFCHLIEKNYFNDSKREDTVHHIARAETPSLTAGRKLGPSVEIK